MFHRVQKNYRQIKQDFNVRLYQCKTNLIKDRARALFTNERISKLCISELVQFGFITFKFWRSFRNVYVNELRRKNWGKLKMLGSNRVCVHLNYMYLEKTCLLEDYMYLEKGCLLSDHSFVLFFNQIFYLYILWHNEQVIGNMLFK